MTGRVGVCDVTVSPGAVKLPSGLLEAFNSSIPVLCIVSDVLTEHSHLVYRGAASQAMNQEGLLRDFCASVVTLRSVRNLP